LRACGMPAEKLVAFVLGYAPTRPGFRQGCVVSCDASVLARPGAAGLNSRPAVLGWIIVSSALRLIDTSRHSGSGVMHYGDGERSSEWSETVPESQYKRHNYVMSAMMLGLGLFLWGVVARTAQRDSTKPQQNDRSS